jgi:hypothetical protein
MGRILIARSFWSDIVCNHKVKEIGEGNVS